MGLTAVEERSRPTAHLSEEPHHDVDHPRQKVRGNANLPRHVDPGVLLVEGASRPLGPAGVGVIDAVEYPEDEGEAPRGVEAVGLGGEGPLVLARHAYRHPRVVHVAEEEHDPRRGDDPPVEDFLQVLVGGVQGEDGSRESQERREIVEEQGT